jgi:hypothetical protein
LLETREMRASGSRRAVSTNTTVSAIATPISAPPMTAWSATRRPIPSPSDAAASASRAVGGVTPKNRGSAVLISTGTGPVSLAGSS